MGLGPLHPTIALFWIRRVGRNAADLSVPADNAAFPNYSADSGPASCNLCLPSSPSINLSFFQVSHPAVWVPRHS